MILKHKTEYRVQLPDGSVKIAKAYCLNKDGKFSLEFGDGCCVICDVFGRKFDTQFHINYKFFKSSVDCKILGEVMEPEVGKYYLMSNGAKEKFLHKLKNDANEKYLTVRDKGHSEGIFYRKIDEFVKPWTEKRTIERWVAVNNHGGISSVYESCEIHKLKNTFKESDGWWYVKLTGEYEVEI